MRNTQAELRWIKEGLRKATRPKSGPVPQPKAQAGNASIAIVGLSGIFPQAASVDAFWQALEHDKSLIEEIPKSRFDWQALYDPRDKTKLQTKWGGFIPKVGAFDPHFFNIMPAEAKLMDPRQRLLLMVVYHCLEDAGYAPASLKKSATGVFVGSEDNEYVQTLAEQGTGMGEPMGHAPSMIANRISYYFDFRGPSEFVNTMCSGAAVALHRAVSALRSGEIDQAIVAAANLLLRPEPFVGLAAIGQLSPNAEVHSFGKDANGFVRSEGVASVMLKTLAQAEADGDAIYAVIKHSAVNYNGQGATSIAAPNPAAHVDVIKRCYLEAGIDPRKIRYIEAQGMGNPVADIAEWNAFNRALAGLAKEKGVTLPAGNCAISTLKPLIGHMHSASALGAMFKIVRSLQTDRIYKILNFKEVNPELDIEDQPCRLLSETQRWPKSEHPRLAALHSYGSGGNNAHVLIEEYHARKPVDVPSSGLLLIPVSARSKQQCKQILHHLLERVSHDPDASLPRIAHTLQVGRDAMQHRVAFLAKDRHTWLNQAQLFLADEQTEGVFIGEAKENKRRVSQHTNPQDIAQDWVKGAELKPPKRGTHVLHLPTYPFATKAYWVQPDPTRVAAPTRKPQITNQAETEPALRKILSNFLEVEPSAIDMNSEFSSLGFNSLLVVHLAEKIEQRFDLKVEPALFFEYTTPAKLAQYLDSGTKTALPDDLASPKQLRRQAARSDQIAIVGLAGSYPQAPTIAQLWQNLTEARDSVTEVPPERWSLEDYYDPDPEHARQSGKSYGKWGGFIDGLYEFDPLFFNLSPREAEYMNPKDRIFLQTVWRVLEDAGYPPQQLSDERVGVFAGVTRAGVDLQQSSSFSVANRISYTFDFQGPSMTIDTACSSSLVAIHEACRNIHAGECSVAIAGGVHAFLHPTHFVALSHAQMLAPDGKCKTFSAQADGMVPGEGVGALLLKPLSQALQDGDQIYGVIRGSETNHGGKTNGFTVPNPKAHRDLIRGAMERSGVHANEISYVEAHGTGTTLGDPIEVRGLTEAFRADTEATGYCSIGSIKTNIGHLEAAAGISGITKILLQIQHRQLVPSLHSKELNPHIDFASSPFRVQRNLEAWQPTDANDKPLPRIGCISSFGAGGTNAHVIIEEYPTPIKQSTEDPQKPALIVLSAKNETQLNQVVQNLHNHLLSNTDALPQLHDLAYTLQVGRQPLEERLGFVTESLQDLQKTLQAILQQHTSETTIHRGHSKRDKASLALFADEDIAVGIEAWFQKRKYNKILDLWLQGFPVDWHKLYPASKPSRVSLPGYPFAREYYRPKETDGRQTTPAQSTTLHPLVHRNTSDLSQIRFSSTFTGREFFLADHVVGGRKILPGVAYLEMIHAALEQAARPVLQEHGDQAWPVIRNLVWAQPIALETTPQEIHISLSPENHVIHFEIFSQATIYSRGSATYSLPEEAQLDLSHLQAQITQNSLTPKQIYTAYRDLGINYGPGFQALEELHYQDSQVLAKLRLPDAVNNTLNSFSLHPSMLDAALQSILGMMMGEETPKPSIPFALDALERLAPLGQTAWAYLRPSPESSDTIRKTDIDLFDEQQRVCVRMRGFSSRVMETESNIQTTISHPVWQDKQGDESPSPTAFAKHLVLLCGLDGWSPAEIETSDVNCLRLQSSVPNTAGCFQDIALQLLQTIQDLIQKRERTLLQVLIPSQGEDRLYAGLSGMLKTAQQENPRITCQLIEVDPKLDSKQRQHIIAGNKRTPEAAQVRYLADRRQIATWQPMSPPQQIENPWKEHGVYLITGGLGGLGLIFGREIAAKSRTLILLGRSPLNTSLQASIQILEAQGARVEYHAVDVTNEAVVTALIQDVTQRFGGVTGIIHTAGILRDSFILKKTEQDFNAVLAPKVAGTVNLDQATKNLDLDFFVLFSSTSAVLGNPGQADYAAANAYMDSFATYRNDLVRSQERYGKTLSINWPFWQDGGMQISSEAEKALEQTGMVPLQTASGIHALIQGLASEASQIMVIEGDQNRIQAAFTQAPKAKPKQKPRKATTATPVSSNKTADFLKELLSTTLKLPASEIDAGAPLETYGIDSIMAMEMTSQLEETFGSLSKTLFFEYQTILELAEFFLEQHPEKIQMLYGETQPSKPQATKSAAPISFKKRPISFTSTAQPPQKSAAGLDIAIVGVSGRYPQARNLDEYWRNLAEGRDCITEVPQDRWDWRRYYDANREQVAAHYSKWGGFIQDADKFDPMFFNILPREAEFIDPQERIFLETAWAALEDAGYSRSAQNLPSQVGVYAGVMYSEYQLYGAAASALGTPMTLGGSYASIANRVSYLLNLQGPSMTLDTMCSSSLTTIHLAAQDLVLGRTEMALAGGVNLSIHPNKYLMLSIGQYISSDGRCESFGEGGDGYIPGEGVGVVVLKRLLDAERDGDHIYGVIKGSAVNHDGKTNGYSVPNPKAQTDVINRALAEAKIDPRSISYIEAHGTGTKLGDPIEITGLTKALKTDQRTGWCAVGSVKSNIGHCESAAGIAGVTKVLLQMKHQRIAPSLHSTNLNPHIDFANTPFVVNQELREWQQPEIDGQIVPRTAGISSFGAGGSNAHLIIQEYVSPTQPSITVQSSQPVMVPLSAKNSERLKQISANLLRYLQAHPQIDLNDLAYTLQVGREALEERLGLIVQTQAELENKLQTFIADHSPSEGFFQGRTKRNNSALAELKAADDFQETLDAWFANRQYAKLLELWTQGLKLDWSLLYKGKKPKRISLPTYPFARERYWVPSVHTPEPQPTQAIVSPTTEPQGQLVTLQPTWEAIPEPKLQAAPPSDAKLLIVGEVSAETDALRQRYPNAQQMGFSNKNSAEDIASQIKDLGTLDHIIWIAPHRPLDSITHESLITDQDYGVLQLFRMVKALLSLGYGSKSLSWTLMTRHSYGLISNDSFDPTHASVHGLAGSLAKEYSHWSLRLIDTDKNFALNYLLQLPFEKHGNPLFYRGSQWYQQSLNPVSELPKEHTRYRKQGVYVVIGGAGGIGVAWSQWMMQHFDARIIWIGRREKDASIQAKRATLAPFGTPPTYIQADATSKSSLQAAYDTIKQTHPHIHGVIHSAIVLRDSSFANMDEATFKMSLSAKVDVSVCLAQVFHAEPLDFVLFFSSMTSFTKAPGQSNYAAGCVFKDAFAKRLAQAWSCPVKVMNWGYWGSVGVAADSFHQERMQREGVGSIEPEEGMAALAALLDSPLDQVGLVKVLNQPKPVKTKAEKPGEPQPQAKQPASESHNFEQVQAKLMQVIKELLLLPEGHVLDGDATFSDLGLDSITSVGFIRGLAETYDLEFRETLVFDYPTIDDLTTYIVEQLPQAPAEAAPEPEPRETVPFKQHLGAMMEQHKSVVPLQLEGEGPLLFCLHPMSGDVGIYSRLSDDAQQRFRVIGLRAKGFLSDESTNTSIEAMAIDFATIMTQIDPTGPYHLFGVSVGGTLAFECARQLQHQDKTVATLLLGEAPLVENDADATLWDSDDAHNWVMNANFLMIAMLHMDPEFRARKAAGNVTWADLEITVAEAAGQIPHGLPQLIRQRGVTQTEDILQQRLQHMATTHLNNLRALNRYRATSSNINATLLRTRTAQATSPHVYNPDYLVNIQREKGGFAYFLEGWHRVLPNLETVQVNGENHFDLLSTAETVAHVADIIATMMQTRKPIAKQPRDGKIAIVGISGQFPGAPTPEAFYQLLKNGQSAITDVPAARQWPELPVDIKGGFLEDIAAFDPHFFQIAPKEAEMIDPAERFFLQESWRALEDAGVDPQQLSGKRWGVFCGGGGDYTLRLKDLLGVSPHVTSSIPGRVAYHLNLTGPAIAVDVGCASSLMAISQACDYLLLDRCDAAIAGGVAISSTPNLLLASNEMLSKHYTGQVFNANAKGMIPAEGVGVVVLKHLDQALADDDRIYGVIEGWASNNSGKTNGMAAPSVVAETALFNDVYQRFDIDPATISLMEANATGTPLGDMIEVQALTDAFRKHTEQRNFCALSSVENNIGHAWQASGMAHLFKVLLAIKHGEIPATLNAEAANPALKLESSPFYINKEPQAWPATQPRRAAINSFGTTGTSVHMVVTEAPQTTQPAASTTTSPTLMVLSAASESSLKQRCRDLRDFADQQPLTQLAANLLRRAQLPVRCAFVVEDYAQLHQQLTTYIEGQEPDAGFTGTISKKVRPSLAHLAQTTAAKTAPTKADLLMLADLYVQGVPFQIDHLFTAADKRPFSLPAYPFAKKRCWLDAPGDVTPTQADPAESTHTIAIIKAQITSITGHQADEIDETAAFSTFGMDSLMSIRLLAGLNEQFGMEMDLSDLLGHSNVRGVAAFIESQSTQTQADRSSETEQFAPNAHWLAERPLPDGLHLLSLKPQTVSNERTLQDSGKAILAQLLQQGIAVFHEGNRCCFLAHRSVDLHKAVNNLPSEQQQELMQQIPLQTLLAPLSHEQFRNLYHSEVMQQCAWNIQHIYEINLEKLDLVTLNQAMAHVVAQQDVLGTHFLALDQTWAQVVTAETTQPIQTFEAASLDAFKAHIETQRNQLLNVAQQPIFQVWVCQVEGKWHIGVISHHALADAFTTTMLFSQLMEHYQALQQGQTPDDDPPSEQFWTYTLKQMETHRKQNTRHYWERQLADRAVTMQLPFKQDPKTLDATQFNTAAAHIVSLPEELCDKIKAFSAAHDITHTQLFTAAIATLLTQAMGNSNAALHFYNNQRDRASLLNTLGEFTNILFLLLDIKSHAKVIDVLQQVKRQSAESLRYAKLEFSQLLNAAGFTDHDAYFKQTGDVIIDSADIDTSTLDAASSHGRSLYAEFSEQQEPADLQATGTLFYQILRVNQRIHLLVTYRKHLFDAAKLYDLSTLIVKLVSAMVENPNQTIAHLLDLQPQAISSIQDQVARHKAHLPKPKSERFPELVRLNNASGKRPVFWIHGGLGGVEGYYKIAMKCPRPFYGVQARGWMTDRTPMQGVRTMAAFYIHAIQSLQSEGPYDLGGYSLGGLLAYEVTRQLQELGHTVNSITMLDSFDGAKNHTPDHLHAKVSLFHAVNQALTFTIRDQPEKVHETLLHRDMVDPSLDEDAFLDQLIALAKSRGLTKTKEQLQAATRQNADVVAAYRVDEYSTAPLPEPTGVTCYYFRNKSGLFLGEFEPYFTLPGVQILVENTRYWAGWEQLLPNLHIMDVDASSHMTFLSEPKVHDTIIEFCANLYAQNTLPQSYLTSFKEKTQQAHGVLEDNQKAEDTT